MNGMCGRTVKHRVSFLLIAAILAGCSKSTSSTDASKPDAAATPSSTRNYPTLVVDERHLIKGSNKLVPYTIDPVAGIRLNIAHFHFTYGTSNITPDMVQLAGNHSVYGLSRPHVTNIYVIDSSTLQVLRGESFHGFHSGDHLMCAIGRLASSSNPGNFWVSWVGEIDVK
jgi:hypothetical protein